MAILICLKKVKRREKGVCACAGGGPQGGYGKSTPSERSILKCDKAAQVPPSRDKAQIEAILSDKHGAFFPPAEEAGQSQENLIKSPTAAVAVTALFCFHVFHLLPLLP